jgi:hypothetical protein
LWLRVAALGSLAFTVNALVLFSSRGAFLGLVGSLAIFGLRVVWEKKDPKIAVKVSIAGLICLGVLVYMADNAFWERMGTLKNPTINPDRFTEEVTDMRVQYWMKTFDMLADHPLGLGGRGYEAMSPNYMPAEWLTNGRRGVHSIWFEVLGDFGYQGLLLFVLYLVANFRGLAKSRIWLREQDNQFRLMQSFALESSLVALLIPSTFLGAFFLEFIYWPPLFIAIFFNLFWLRKVTDDSALLQPVLSRGKAA